MQRIQSITLRNFKFFYGKETKQEQNKLELNQNNLLLYGENGSGKSSIYWALYTFLQSCLKTDEQISKYFDPTDSQNLRNRFADNADDSAIILEIVSSTGTITKEISNKKLETNKSADTTINKIIAGSDFINYKYLSKLYDFRNSEEIDLFPMFEQEVLMFLDFEKSYTDNKGNLSKSTLAGDWWNFICTSPKTLTPNKKNINTANRHSPEYKMLMDETIPTFIKELKGFLKRITDKANNILEKEFNESFKVNFDTETITCNYNNKIGIKNISKPIIPLKIIFDHSKLEGDKKNIVRPHTFLNEARLTAIALAIRLAMLDERLYDENSASLLVLDDLLLSLDMSHRDKVLDIILKKVDEYQILILTHDRAFYNLCKRRIGHRVKPTDLYKWEFKEMYQSTVKDSDIPCPFIPENKNYLDLAKKYLYEFDYPACANYLRKESERVLTNILPNNKTIGSDLDKGSQKLLLNALINKFEEYCTSISFDFTPFEKLKEYKDLLMNPLSHHNIESPIYKQEILNTFDVLNKLNTIKIKRFETDPENTIPFVLKETDSNDEVWEYTFYLRELFLVKKDLDGVWIFNNPKCWFTSRKNISTNVEDTGFLSSGLKLNRGYDNIRHTLGIKTDSSIPKELKDIVFKDGSKLLDILNS